MFSGANHKTTISACVDSVWLFKTLKETHRAYGTFSIDILCFIILNHVSVRNSNNEKEVLELGRRQAPGKSGNNTLKK